MVMNDQILLCRNLVGQLLLAKNPDRVYLGNVENKWGTFQDATGEAFSPFCRAHVLGVRSVRQRAAAFPSEYSGQDWTGLPSARLRTGFEHPHSPGWFIELVRCDQYCENVEFFNSPKNPLTRIGSLW